MVMNGRRRRVNRSQARIATMFDESDALSVFSMTLRKVALRRYVNLRDDLSKEGRKQ